ncbi:hypothetical protein BDQ17DRAFT_1375353 [Cyathus striatus]|nr:hypothetical protein BDQ17DRAFT_1375353 [Cyathus striatus]
MRMMHTLALFLPHSPFTHLAKMIPFPQNGTVASHVEFARDAPECLGSFFVAVGKFLVKCWWVFLGFFC